MRKTEKREPKFRSMNQKEFCEATGLSSRQVIHFCERGWVKPEEETEGKGYHRRFGLHNIVEARLANTILYQVGIGIHAGQKLLILAGSLFRSLGYPSQGELVFLDGETAVLFTPESGYTSYTTEGKEGIQPWSEDLLELSGFCVRIRLRSLY